MVFLISLSFQSNLFADDSDLRSISMNRTSKTSDYKQDREKAMLDSIFEAEYKDKDIELKERLKGLKEPLRGSREKEILKRYSQVGVDEPVNLRADEPVAEKKLKKKIKAKKKDSLDLSKGIVRGINEKMYPFKISGEYQMSWGYDSGDNNFKGRKGQWKNADWNKANLVYVQDSQYVFGRERHNTYDKRIYDRFRLKMETVREKGMTFLSEIVVDPWSFTGKTEYMMVEGAHGGEFPLELRYWSNTQSTLDERIWLTNGADFINIPEIKVNDGRTDPTFVTSRWGTNDFMIPKLKIDRDFRPLRKLEVGYRDDNIDIKAFPLADQDHVYTSDDPLILSNKHIYWEPSPWLNRWKPAVFYTPTSDFRRGKWANDISFESRDSDFTFLTLLRGLSTEYVNGDTYLATMIATPMHPWQKYDSLNSLPGVVRFKQRLFKDYYVGSVYTHDFGMNGQKVDAINHVIAIDGGFEKPGFVSLRGEYAYSIDKIDWTPHDARISRTKAEGNAVRIESSGEFLKNRAGDPELKVKASFTHMGDEFRPRLANYRNTRIDQYWGKHIQFETISPDFDAFKIGDGIDVGRNVYHLRIDNVHFKEKLSSLFDVRFVRNDKDARVENVYREEITYKPWSNLSTKVLYRFQDLPTTKTAKDPFIITDDISEDNTDVFLQNNDVLHGENADVWTLSAGFHYDPTKWLGLEGIYERTSDYDTYPQRVLNDAGFRDLGAIRELNYFLYSQPLMAIPPYDDYNIWKGRVFLTPIDTVRAKFEYVLNDFQHATGRDDNINHYGVEVDVDITKRLHTSFKYTRSHLVDLYEQAFNGESEPHYTHDNIFAKVEYDIGSNNTFIMQYGEFFVPEQYTPVPWILNTVDTQRILRLYLKGKF